MRSVLATGIDRAALARERAVSGPPPRHWWLRSVRAMVCGLLWHLREGATGRALAVEVRYAKNRHMRGRPPIILRSRATKDPVMPRRRQSNERARTSGFRNAVGRRTHAIRSFENSSTFSLPHAPGALESLTPTRGRGRVQELQPPVDARAGVGLSKVCVRAGLLARPPR